MGPFRTVKEAFLTTALRDAFNAAFAAEGLPQLTFGILRHPALFGDDAHCPAFPALAVTCESFDTTQPASGPLWQLRPVVTLHLAYKATTDTAARDLGVRYCDALLDTVVAQLLPDNEFLAPLGGVPEGEWLDNEGLLVSRLVTVQFVYPLFWEQGD